MVNNAGVCVCGEFEWQTWSQMEQQVNVNLLGALRVTKYCLPLLKAGQGNKCIVTTLDFTISPAVQILIPTDQKPTVNSVNDC